MFNKRSILVMLVISILFVLTACGANNMDNTKAVSGTNNRQSNNNGNNQQSNNDVATITDIKNWNHPIKPLFNQLGLIKVELLKEKTYPIFYINQPTITEKDVDSNNSDGTYLSMLKANSFWDFEIRALDNKAVIIKGDKANKNISQVLFDGSPFNFVKYDANINKVTDNDLAEVKNLFLSRYLIKGTDNNSGSYALKAAPDQFIYTVYVYNFDSSRNKYVVTLHRSTDTGQNFFLYDADSDKFYRDGNPPEEIKDQSDVFIWGP